MDRVIRPVLNINLRRLGGYIILGTILHVKTSMILPYPPHQAQPLQSTCMKIVPMFFSHNCSWQGYRAQCYNILVHNHVKILNPTCMSSCFTYMFSKAFPIFPSTTRSCRQSIYECTHRPKPNAVTEAHAIVASLGSVSALFVLTHQKPRRSVTHQQSGPRNHVPHRHFIKQALGIFQRPIFCIQVRHRVVKNNIGAGNQPHAVRVNGLAESQSPER